MKGKEKEDPDVKSVARNAKAWHQYHIGERFEAGIVLLGTEVKSLRMGRAGLTEGYAHPRKGEMWLYSIDIPQYPQASFQNHEPTRPRKLLLHLRQIRKIEDALKQKGTTVVPLSLYFRKGKAKVEIGLARGKTHGDKREDLKKRETQREISREMARRR